eukprot:TRINITY_DN21087_c0_g1_i1.p1 TRINITY_DN21087_c0_g1~~TRINITY_DN21087_c0_g1_i1.p1  ORF type:complete len:727 (-),score=112.70 TRINITY_DN21087_c0_g1_i1:98-2278(-)
MEGRASNFEAVLADFEKRLVDAAYVAVSMELTGTDIADCPDGFEESAGERLSKLCRIAEENTPIQIGFTLLAETNSIGFCTSYNFLVFPRDGSFMCNVAALQLNQRNGLDLNAWVNDGIPYLTRDEELRLRNDGDSELLEKTGLLRLWKLLCNRKLPLVVHCPEVLFFLLACFERRPLPRHSPHELAALVFSCFNDVYDTAYLHGAIGDFRSLGLAKFLRDARARLQQLEANGRIEPLDFELEECTARRFHGDHGNTHEAAWNSLMTAQLFAMLLQIQPRVVCESAFCLYLFKSSEFLDLKRAHAQGIAGSCVFDLSRVTPLVVRLESADDKKVPRRIAAAGFECRRMDSFHILVVLKSSGVVAIEQAVELSLQVWGIVQWIPLGTYLEEIRRTSRGANQDHGTNTESVGGHVRPKVADCDLRPSQQQCLEQAPVRSCGAAFDSSSSMVGSRSVSSHDAGSVTGNPGVQSCRWGCEEQSSMPSSFGISADTPRMVPQSAVTTFAGRGGQQQQPQQQQHLSQRQGERKAQLQQHHRPHRTKDGLPYVRHVLVKGGQSQESRGNQVFFLADSELIALAGGSCASGVGGSGGQQHPARRSEHARRHDNGGPSGGAACGDAFATVVTPASDCKHASSGLLPALPKPPGEASSTSAREAAKHARRVAALPLGGSGSLRSTRNMPPSTSRRRNVGEIDRDCADGNGVLPPLWQQKPRPRLEHSCGRTNAVGS